MYICMRLWFFNYVKGQSHEIFAELFEFNAEFPVLMTPWFLRHWGVVPQEPRSHISAGDASTGELWITCDESTVESFFIALKARHSNICSIIIMTTRLHLFYVLHFCLPQVFLMNSPVIQAPGSQFIIFVFLKYFWGTPQWYKHQGVNL